MSQSSAQAGDQTPDHSHLKQGLHYTVVASFFSGTFFLYIDICLLLLKIKGIL